MVTHMKTTVDIADSLFEAARRAAARERTTLRALIEEGLYEPLPTGEEIGEQFEQFLAGLDSPDGES